jgi:uncharacterized protein (TIGR00725 family)
MKTMIGVMGSVAGFNPQASELSHQLGQAIAEHDCIIVTGACPGLPHDAVRGAKEAGGLTVGVSPGHNFAEHTIKYDSPWQEYDVIIYTGSGLMGREITGVRSCDIVIVVGGRSGTLGEFAIAYDEGKLIGVLKGTGGLSAHIEALVEVIQKETGAQIVYDNDPSRLIDTLVAVAAERSKVERAQLIEPQHVDCNAEFCTTTDSIEKAIVQMEKEVFRMQANIAAQRQRLDAYRDLVEMGPGERGKG